MRTVLALGGVVLLSGCATFAHGRFQEVEITSEPSGALVFRGNMLLGVTPMRSRFARRESTIALRFEKQGYRHATVSLERGTSAWLAADLAFGPLQAANQGLSSGAERAAAAVIAPSIMLGIDFATGAAFTLPPRVIVTLQRHQ